MIAITPDILGPGIDEEYADALAAIDDARVALGPQALTNDTPEGRVLLNMAWVEREIRAGRLPIPVDRSFVGTIFYLVGSHELARYPGFQDALGRLWLVLKGYGLIKPRHLPVLLAMMEDFVAEAEHCPAAAGAGPLIAAMRREADRLAASGELPPRRRPQDQFMLQVTPELDDCMARATERATDIDSALFEGWRPGPARKPPLAAPVPGLPDRAPPLPPELAEQLP